MAIHQEKVITLSMRRDILGVLALMVILIIGHIFTSDNGLKDIRGIISRMEKAISELIGWINRQ